ncbi:hypothetical protein, partial [Cloacibacterium normanense]|uniref:hypothetical protein n=1 Tax=Cloacibacterium normanense TaxID=237258 RepID=UPI001C876FE1
VIRRTDVAKVAERISTTSGKGLAKAGLRNPKFSIITKLSKNHFRFFKITKNKKTKWFFAAKSAEIF